MLSLYLLQLYVLPNDPRHVGQRFRFNKFHIVDKWVEILSTHILSIY